MAGRFALMTCAGASASAVCLSYFDPDTAAHLKFNAYSAMMPAIHALFNAEDAHNLGIWAAQYGLWPIETRPDSSVLRTKLWGLEFNNPIGVAAGFDKDAKAMQAVLQAGFGFVEIGSVTPLPQAGNEKPRVFRLQESRSIINRYGFNSEGLDAAEQRLRSYRERSPTQDKHKEQNVKGVVGVNVGKNKQQKDAIQDYGIALRRLQGYSDYLVVNLSSPNTPGLRDLQRKSILYDLVKSIKQQMCHPLYPDNSTAKPLLIKIAPDLLDSELQDIADVALQLGIDGIIVSNTTISRDGISPGDQKFADEAGGLSGPPLFDRSTAVLKRIYILTKGSIPLIGCGGVTTGQDAYQKIKAGASLVQLYTALAFEGPSLVYNLKQDLTKCLKQDGYSCVAEAVGSGVDLSQG